MTDSLTECRPTHVHQSKITRLSTNFVNRVPHRVTIEIKGINRHSAVDAVGAHVSSLTESRIFSCLAPVYSVCKCFIILTVPGLVWLQVVKMKCIVIVLIYSDCSKLHVPNNCWRNYTGLEGFFRPAYANSCFDFPSQFALCLSLGSQEVGGGGWVGFIWWYDENKHLIWIKSQQQIKQSIQEAIGQSQGGGSLRKIGQVCAATFQKPVPYLWPTSVIFPNLFMTWQNIRYPIYDRCGWHSCLKHNLWRAFVDGLIDSDEKVPSSYKTYPVQDYRAYTIPYLWSKSIPYFWTKRLKTIPFGV